MTASAVPVGTAAATVPPGRLRVAAPALPAAWQHGAMAPPPPAAALAGSGRPPTPRSRVHCQCQWLLLLPGRLQVSSPGYSELQLQARPLAGQVNLSLQHKPQPDSPEELKPATATVTVTVTQAART